MQAEVVTRAFGKTGTPIRVPLTHLDAAEELRLYNSSLILANVLSSRLQRLLRNRFRTDKWRRFSFGEIDLDELATTRYQRVSHFEHTVVGLRPDLGSIASGLSRLNDREPYTGCLALFWREMRQSFEDGDLCTLRGVLADFVGNS